MQSKIKTKDSSKIQQVSATYTNNFPADEKIGLSSKSKLDHIHFSSQIDKDESTNKHNYTIQHQTKVQKPNQQLFIINQHRDSIKEFLFQYKENGKTTKQNVERMKEATVSNSTKGSSIRNSGGMLIIPTERESQTNNSSDTSVNNNINMRVRSNKKESLFDHSNNNNRNISKDNMIHSLTLGKICISTIELPTTKEEDWKVCNKLEEDNIIDNSEVMKVNVKQSDKTVLQMTDNMVSVNKFDVTNDTYSSEFSDRQIVARNNTTKDDSEIITLTPLISRNITNTSDTVIDYEICSDKPKDNRSLHNNKMYVSNKTKSYNNKGYDSRNPSIESNDIFSGDVLRNKVYRSIHHDTERKQLIEAKERNIKIGKVINVLKVVEKIEDTKATGMVGDEEDIDHLVHNSKRTSTYIKFNLSNKEEINTSYANEPKLKQSSILSKQKQNNIALTTTENKEGIEERYEEMNGYTVGNEVDNKVFRNIGMGNEYLTSDKKQITDEVVNINEDEISTDKGLMRNNNSDKSLVILPLTIKDDLMPSNKLETVEIIDNNVVTKVIIAQSNHIPTQKLKKMTAKNIQMNYLDEKYSSAGNTNIYND